MRIENSIKNIFMSLFSQIVIAILGFISRKVFLDSLGIDYLGVNGLLTNVLSMMALVEGGIGMSIVYNLYKPLSENDQQKVIALVQLYKKVYWTLAIIILLISLSLFPFLDNMMKDGDSISNLTIIYFLFIVKNLVSYLNAHKWSLINSDQKGYVLTGINLIFQIITTLAKIIVLILTHDYILYLIIELIILIIQNIINGRIVNRRYSYIKTRVKYSIDRDTKDNIIMNVKALFLHNIGSFCVFGTDNILISSFISIATVGVYSNYTMIIGQLSSLLGPIIGGIGASVGNLIVTESSDKNYSIFKVTYLVNFWIYSFGVIFLFNLLEPFISWWLGEEYLLNWVALILILVNFYLGGMRTAITTFKSRAGLFVQDKYAPLIEGVINLISSLVLLQYFGLAGIFLGTTISSIATVFWIQPYIVYKNVFKRTVWSYFTKYIFYTVLTIVACIITSYLCNILVKGDSFLSLISKGMVCLIVPNIIYLSIFYKSKEFQYIWRILFARLKAKNVNQKQKIG